MNIEEAKKIGSKFTESMSGHENDEYMAMKVLLAELSNKDIQIKELQENYEKIRNEVNLDNCVVVLGNNGKAINNHFGENGRMLFNDKLYKKLIKKCNAGITWII